MTASCGYKPGGPGAQARPRRGRGLREAAGSYTGILCDVWGVLHNGARPFPAACEALARFRAGGGEVVLLSNAPRPAGVIREQLAQIGVPPQAYDAVVTSGDAVRAALDRGVYGAVCHHLGPDRDRPLFAGAPLACGDLDEAAFILCTGLRDDVHESAEDYRPVLARARARDLPMVCANPDIEVMRGEQTIPCAGALARLYEGLGGRVDYFGKPHRPIYDRACALLGGAGRILAIGDGLETDIKGAGDYGLDSLFITGGLARRQLGEAEAEEVAAFCRRAGFVPDAYMPVLTW